MTYLLDVNALIGYVYLDHTFHSEIAAWIRSLNPANDALASCSITELGLIRILPQIPEANYTVQEAQRLLASFKDASELPFHLLDDHLGADKLPGWVKQPKHTTDGHLVYLAKAHGAVLATLDRKIPGAFLIPS